MIPLCLMFRPIHHAPSRDLFIRVGAYRRGEFIHSCLWAAYSPLPRYWRLSDTILLLACPLSSRCLFGIVLVPCNVVPKGHHHYCLSLCCAQIPGRTSFNPNSLSPVCSSRFVAGGLLNHAHIPRFSATSIAAALFTVSE